MKKAKYKRLKTMIPIIILFIIPFLFSGQYYLHLCNLSFIYGMLSLGLFILLGFIGQLSVGQAGFFGIGAYTSAVLTTKLGFPVFPTILLAGIVAVLFGLLLGLPSLRLKGLLLAVVTLGFGQISHLVFLNWDEVTNGSKGILNIPYPNLFGFEFTDYVHFYYLLLAVTIFFVWAVYRLNNSRFGRALKAIRESENSAKAMGINTYKYKLGAFMISAFISGVAGSFYAHELAYIGPESFTEAASITILAMVVVGGMDSIIGAVLGGAILTFVPEYLRFLGDFRLVLFGVAIILVLMFYPGGIGEFIEKIDSRLREKVVDDKEVENRSSTIDELVDKIRG